MDSNRFGCTGGNILAGDPAFDMKRALDGFRRAIPLVGVGMVLDAVIGPTRVSRRLVERRRVAATLGIEAAAGEACPFRKRQYRRAWTVAHALAPIARKAMEPAPPS